MSDQIVPEKELTAPVTLCAANGKLNRAGVGWSRRPLHTCNLSGHPLRKKRWNYWAITTPDLLFSTTLSNVDYLGLNFAYLFDVKSGRFIEKTVQNALGKGYDLGDTVEDDVVFDGPGMPLAYTHARDEIRISVSCPDFDGQPLKADFVVKQPAGHETLNVVIPWDDDHFQFTSKQNTLPARGAVSLGKETFTFDGENCFACLDFGRGVWPFDSVWNWASASGVQGRHVVGLNLGGKWTDGTGMNENGLCVDGRLTKLSEDMAFEYSTADFMKPWRIRTTVTKRVDLTFTPFKERHAKTDFVVLKSEVHQMFGHFSGTITPDGGKEIKIEKLFGWAEDHAAKW